MDLAGQLKYAIRCLKDSQPKEAAEKLQAVLQDPEFAKAEDFQDIRARVHSYYAQALLDLNAFDEARQAAESALALAQELEDRSGERQVRDLLRQISGRYLQALRVAGAMRNQASESDISIDTLLAGDEPASAPQRLLQQAALKLQRECGVEAEQLVQRVLSMDAATRKDRLIACLMLAHLRPDEAPETLEQAWCLADESNDFTLLQAVAQTAKQLNCPIAILNGPQLGN